jgi:ATP diphosphatase
MMHPNRDCFTQALQTQHAAAKVGFDWPNATDVLAKLDEEINELKQGIAAQDKVNIAEELGDVLYTVVNLARHLQLDPAAALQAATQKFTTRFQQVETLAAVQKIDLSQSTIEELETLWQRVKKNEGAQYE